MQLNIGASIKNLRKSKDLTQEQLAEIFGVSFQAVSKWETGAAYPDIEMLPELAAYFGVTVDEMIGAGEAKRKALIDEHLRKFDEALTGGHVNEAVELSRAAAAEFPGSWTLQNQLMYALFVAGSDDGNVPNWQENQRNYDAEIIALGKKITQLCPDDSLRLEAKARLALLYCDTGRRAQALPLIETLPSEDNCREYFYYWALEHEERLAHVRKRMIKGMELLAWSVRAYVSHGGAEAPEGKIAWRNKLKRCLEIILDGKFGGWHELLAKMEAQNARDIISLGDHEAALAHLELMAEHAAAYQGEDPCHTADSRTLAQMLREDWLARPCFDCLREDVRFSLIVADFDP